VDRCLPRRGGADQAAAVPDISAETRLSLQQALGALPAGKRAVLVLRYLEDLPEVDRR